MSSSSLINIVRSSRRLALTKLASVLNLLSRILGRYSIGQPAPEMEDFSRR